MENLHYISQGDPPAQKKRKMEQCKSSGQFPNLDIIVRPSPVDECALCITFSFKAEGYSK